MKTTAAVLIAIAALAAPAGAQQRIDETFAVDPRGSLEIVNVAGNVTVTAWDRNEIRVTGTLGRGTERLELNRNRENSQIRVVLPRRARDVRGSDLDVRVPAGKHVTVRTVSADIGIVGVRGRVDATSTSGDLIVSGQPSEVRAGSTSGDVEVDVRTTGRVQAHSTSGNVEVQGTVNESVAVESVSGDVVVTASTPEVRAESVSGDLQLSGVTGRVSASTVSGDASVRGSRITYGAFETVSGNLLYAGDVADGGALDLESHSGTIEMVLPANVSADFEASTFSGEIQSDFGGEVVRTSRYGPGREMRLVTGREGGRVRIQTFSGTVKLRRR